MLLKIKMVFQMLFICVSAFSLTVDFAPIANGNTWVYDLSVINYPGPSWNLRRIISVTNVTRDANTNNIVFDVSVRDSGQKGADSSFDTTFFVNSLVKTKDSISSAGVLANYFDIATKDTVSWDSGQGPFVRHGYYFQYNDLILYIEINNYREIMSYSSNDSAVYLEKTGLLFRNCGYWGHSTGGSNTTIQLITFNGKTPLEISQISINVTPNMICNRREQLGMHPVGILRGLPDEKIFRRASMYDLRGRLVNGKNIITIKGIYFVNLKDR